MEKHKFEPMVICKTCFRKSGKINSENQYNHQQESQQYMVHLWNTSGTGIECGIEAGTVVSKSRIAEVDCAECITSLNSQPEHRCDKHQAVFSYNVVYGIRHYVCTQCFIEQPATHPAEAPEGLRAVEAFYKAELDQARQRIKELEAMLNKPISLASIGYRIGEADMRCHDKIGERYGKMQDDLISEINTLLKERSK